MSNKKSRGNASRRKAKRLAMDMLGGSCSVCGYNRCQAALDFHHKNPEEKEFKVSYYRKKDIFVKEVLKCELLCKNCHAEKHAEDKSTNISAEGRMVKTCRVHGDTIFYTFNLKSGNKKHTCATCMIERQKAARVRLKIDLIEVMGGCCEDCGYKKHIEALEFHHLSGKDRQVSTIRNRQKAFEEIQKCRLLCRNCHMEAHWMTA